MSNLLKRRWPTAAVALAALGGAAAAAGARRARRFEAEIDGHVDALRAAAAAGSTDADADPSTLPAPVERYLGTVLGDGPTAGRARLVRLRQRGEFRLGGPDAPWRPLRATQHVAVDPPGFVWDATIDVFPLLPARVVDLYANGEGILRAKLRSAVTVADAGPSPEMNEGELTRYLAEAVWYPDALLDRAVEWEAIDDRSARATLEHRGVTASLVFHVDDRGLVTRVTADRYRQEDDAYAPWTGRFRDYAERDGLLVPLEADVEWNLPEGDLPYWRARVTSIERLTDGDVGGRG
ncbi:DUF6920 family protein [Salinilacihabitans rarus]|uniref:DUF6920 family protein n=1 Tax=Salinilacihabitans rarus TaxID=2961596 RepID=UPI0020C92503|nr:DUF6544 family protein [Salinilacihabitans rarus]